MTNIKEIFAQNLKKNRQNCGLSQANLAEMVSVSTHHIAMMEIARHSPTLDLVERVANALNVEIYELFVDPLSTPVEMERLYEITAKNIEQLAGHNMERLCQTAAKSIEQIVEVIENALAGSQAKKGG